MAEQEMTSRQVTDRAWRQAELQERKVRRIKEQIKQVRKSKLDEYEVEDQATGETTRPAHEPCEAWLSLH